MNPSERRSRLFVLRRVVARTLRYLIHDPVLVLLVTGLVAFLVLAGAFGLIGRSMASPVQADDAADHYMRGLRDHDVSELFGSLSPDMRRTLEQRFGRLGPAAVAALFTEEERSGERIVGYKLVARYDTVQGDSLRFYVVQAQRGNERRDVPYTLTIDQSGKVSKVE